MESPARLGIGGIVIPGKGLQEALKLACERLGNPNASITAIPDGVSVVTTLKE